MSGFDLKTPDGLKAANNEVERTIGDPDWRLALKAQLEYVRAASMEERASVGFQQRLWDDNSIASVGQGQINIDAAIADQGFREWVAEQSELELPEPLPERARVLKDLYQEMQHRLKPFCSRMPHLKIFRVLATFYPESFTTVADRFTIRRLQILMFGTAKSDPVNAHLLIRRRLDEVLGLIDSENLEQLVTRLTLPWLLYALVVESGDDKTIEAVAPGEEKLVPLPASRRRRGLTAIRGLFPEMLSILEFVRDGVTREELLDHLRSGNPKSKDVSLRMTINVLRSEFAVIRLDGDHYVLSPRGEAVVESGDADDVRDWLLTRILGLDNVIVFLRDASRAVELERLDRVLQEANPGWTSTFAPRAMLNWLRSMKVIDRDSHGRYSLTALGQEWGRLVYWTPECLPTDESDEVVSPSEVETVAGPQLPEIQVILEVVQQKGHFPVELVESLHLGVWADPLRHFAILTGLSGAGKTMLGAEYGRAIVGQGPGKDQRLLILPVQPGWYDPSPLFGYVNPLSKDSYEGTDFLNMLMSASEHPEKPHVVVLDEMNLSHPEQYLAPLLSAMETGTEIRLHNKGEHFDGVPARLLYPRNLVIVGTVNMDETTLGLSDKVLDRAFVLEFWEIDIAKWPGWDTTSLLEEESATL